MPHSDLHERKKKRNLMMLAAIGGWIVLIWVVTMVKLGLTS